MLRNSMLAFVVSAEDQNKSPEDEKDTISVTKCYVRFLYLGYVEKNVSYVLFSSDFKFVLFFFPQCCVCMYVFLRFSPLSVK